MQRSLAIFFVLTVAGCSSSHIAPPTPANAHILNVADLNTEQIAALDRAHTVVMLDGGILQGARTRLTQNYFCEPLAQ